MTAFLKPGTETQVRLYVYADKTFEMEFRYPSSTWFLKQAAGIEKGSDHPFKLVGTCYAWHQFLKQYFLVSLGALKTCLCWDELWTRLCYCIPQKGGMLSRWSQRFCLEECVRIITTVYLARSLMLRCTSIFCSCLERWRWFNWFPLLEREHDGAARN